MLGMSGPYEEKEEQPIYQRVEGNRTMKTVDPTTGESRIVEYKEPMPIAPPLDPNLSKESITTPYRTHDDTGMK